MRGQFENHDPFGPFTPFAPEIHFLKEGNVRKKVMAGKGVRGAKGSVMSPSPVTPIHEHEWEKQPDLCLYERHKSAFWVALLCTTCGRLGGYHLPKKSLPLRAIPQKVKEITPMREF